MIYLRYILCDHAKAKLEGLSTQEETNKYVDCKAKQLGIDFRKWVRDTVGFSIAHLKELFIAVVILGDKYETSVKTLRSMRDHIRGSDDQGGKMGFGRDEMEEFFGDDGGDCCGGAAPGGCP